METLTPSPALVFISYCHKDGKLIDELLDYISPLERSGEAVIWSDRNIPAGKPLEIRIEEKLHAADIVVFCISPNFLNSDACMEEFKTTRIRLDNEDAIAVSFILSDCRWKDYEEICKNKVLPNDGHSVLAFNDHGTAFDQLFEKLREDSALVARQRKLSFSNEFSKELQQIGPLGGFRKDGEVSLSDIYVDPDLRDVSVERETKDKPFLSAVSLPDIVESKQKVVISGQMQSGKTSLCRMLCMRLFEKGLIPVSFSGDSRYQGNYNDSLNNALKKQYSDIGAIRQKKIVPILDEFHHAKKPDKVLSDVILYERCVLIVDDLYDLDIRNKTFLKDFVTYEIVAFGARKRSELIGKWLGIDSTGFGDDTRIGLEKLDETNEAVTSMLGKVLGKGLMPSFPFFILLIVATLEHNQSFGDREITSQSYCYHALLVFALSQKGVKNNQFDTYFNFLSELAIAMYRNNDMLDADGLEKFLDSYQAQFNLPIRTEDIMSVLNRAGIVIKNGLGYYKFTYRYLHFFFVAKYFADHEQECDSEIKQMLNGLGESRNAYIAVFLTYHSKSEKALDSILDVAQACLPNVKQSSLLRKEDLSFFDGHIKRIAQASLNALQDSPAQAREQQLARQEKMEDAVDESNMSDSQMVREFVSALRTTDVLGQVIKNRAGSLKREHLGKVIRTILDIHGKIYTQFFLLIQEAEIEESMIELIAYWLSKHPKIVSQRSREQIKELASTLFWNLNFQAICGITMHCVRSVGSDQLWPVVKEVCDQLAVPLGEVIKIGTEIYYKNRVPIPSLQTKKDELPIVAWSIVREMVVQYCNTHPMKHSERQQVESLLKIKNTFITYQQRR